VKMHHKHKCTHVLPPIGEHCVCVQAICAFARHLCRHLCMHLCRDRLGILWEWKWDQAGPRSRLEFGSIARKISSLSDL
jgi:hypothetical protein